MSQIQTDHFSQRFSKTLTEKKHSTVLKNNSMSSTDISV